MQMVYTAQQKTDKVSPKVSSFNVCLTLLFEWTSRLHYQVPPVAGGFCKLEECFIEFLNISNFLNKLFTAV